MPVIKERTIADVTMSTDWQVRAAIAAILRGLGWFDHAVNGF